MRDTTDQDYRFWIFNHTRGLLWAVDDPQIAEDVAIRCAVNTGRPVELHDRLTED